MAESTATMGEMAMRESAALAAFNIQRADVWIQANYRGQFWPLLYNAPLFYAALLNKLGDLGLTSSGIRIEAGDGSLTGYHVNFWLFNVRALVRIRLERLEIQFNEIASSDVPQLERAIESLLSALAEVNPDFEVASYTIDLSLHGELAGLEPKSYLISFLAKMPTGTGSLTGAGVTFYFEGQPSAPVRTVTLDLSGMMPGRLYVRLLSVFPGSLHPQSLRTAFEEQARDGLEGVGLQIRMS